MGALVERERTNSDRDPTLCSIMGAVYSSSLGAVESAEHLPVKDIKDDSFEKDSTLKVAKLEEYLAAMAENVNESLRQLEKNHNQEMADMKKSHNQEVADMKKSHNQEVADMESVVKKQDEETAALRSVVMTLYKNQNDDNIDLCQQIANLRSLVKNQEEEQKGQITSLSNRIFELEAFARSSVEDIASIKELVKNHNEKVRKF